MIEKGRNLWYLIFLKKTWWLHQGKRMRRWQVTEQIYEKIRNCFHYSITSGNDAVLHQQHEIRKICGSNQQNKHTDMDQEIQMILEGKVAELTIKIEPKLYWKFTWKNKNDKPISSVKLQKVFILRLLTAKQLWLKQS